MKEITKEEFCRLTNTQEDSWLFADPETEYFLAADDKTGIIFYINSNGRMIRFKKMNEYGEIWSSEANWSIWCTWEVID